MQTCDTLTEQQGVSDTTVWGCHCVALVGPRGQQRQLHASFISHPAAPSMCHMYMRPDLSVSQVHAS